MKKIKPGFQGKILILVLSVFTIMSIGIISITYQILLRSVVMQHNNYGATIVESAARAIDIDEFQQILTQKNEFVPYYDQLRRELFRIKNTNYLENMYIIAFENNQSLIYIIDGNERYNDSFISIGTKVEKIRGEIIPELSTSIQNGRATNTQPYFSQNYGYLLSSYYPVYDERGQTIAVVGCDFNYSIIHRSVLQDLKYIVYTIIGFTFLSIIILIVFIKISLIRSVQLIKKHLEYLSSGDLTKKLNSKLQQRADEMGTISVALVNMQQSLEKIVTSILSETDDLSNDTNNTIVQLENLNTGITEISNATIHISSAMEQTAASTEEINATIHQIGESIQTISAKANQGVTLSEGINQKAENLRIKSENSAQNAQNVSIEANKRLKEAINQSKSVTKINSLVDSILIITEQTNLLAINASIEAARAGKLGRGFSVVAEEILTLADESQKAANQILGVTGQVIKSVENLAESASEVLKYVDEIVVEDYRTMVSTARQYSEDACIFKELTNDFRITSDILSNSIEETIKSIEEISRSTAEGSGDTSHIANQSQLLKNKAIEVMNLSEKITISLKTLHDSVLTFKI